MSAINDDDYVDHVFADQDSRSHGRLIQILDVHPNQNGNAWKPTRYFRAIEVDSEGKQVGKQRIKISARTLDTHYKKVR